MRNNPKFIVAADATIAALPRTTINATLVEVKESNGKNIFNVKVVC